MGGDACRTEYSVSPPSGNRLSHGLRHSAFLEETLEGLCVGPVESSSQAVFEGFPFRDILIGQLDSFRKEGLSSLEFFHSYFCCL